METKDFLIKIHEDNHIYFRALGQYPKEINGLYNDNTIKQLKSLNEQGFDIYFVVNGGGTHKNEINKINAVYIDFDAGKDEHKKYFSLDIVQKFKQEKLQIINDFKYKPTFIIETRNGLHVYWLLNEGATIEQFEECQLRLINHFDSDKAVKTPERIMRVPGYYWMKYKDSPFMVEINEYNDIKYSINDILNVLPSLPTNSTNKVRNSNVAGTLVKPSINYNNIDLIKKRDIDGLRYVLFDVRGEGVLDGKKENTNKLFSYIPSKTQNADESTVIGNRYELYDYLCKVDLIWFLGLNNSRFNCIFHNDNSPSANIFINADTGHYIYKCHSETCKFPAGSIIRVIEKLQRCTKPEAINFLKAVFGIELQESEWQKQQKELLQLNKDYLLSGKMEEEYPYLWKRIKPYIGILLVLHNVADMCVQDLPLDNTDRAIFYSGTKHLMNIIGATRRETVNSKINLFAFLELLHKLDENEIPEKLLKKLKRDAALNKQINLKSCYVLPSYSDNILTKAEDNAILFKEKNMSMTGWSRELLYRTYGKDVADKVFPQIKGRKLSKASELFSDDFTKAIYMSIEKQGYATEEQCLNLLGGVTKSNQRKLKRVLQEVLESYSLNRIRCNKDVKKKYNVACNGYPFIIVKLEEIE